MGAVQSAAMLAHTQSVPGSAVLRDGTKKAKPDWFGFRAPAEYLVGCGMDSDELYRNLPDICILRESEP